MLLGCCINFVVHYAEKKTMIYASFASMKWVIRLIISEWTVLHLFVPQDVHIRIPKIL